jgi:hypothetical protein
MATLVYKATGSDGAWATVSNWKTVGGAPFGRIPTSADDVIINAPISGYYSAGDGGGPNCLGNIVTLNNFFNASNTGLSLLCTNLIVNSGGLASGNIGCTGDCTFNGTGSTNVATISANNITFNDYSFCGGGDGPNGFTASNLTFTGNSRIDFENTAFAGLNISGVFLLGIYTTTNFLSGYFQSPVTLPSSGTGGLSASKVLVSRILNLPFPIVV